jgi:hypothetical protein
LEQYRDLLKPTHVWNDVSYDEQMKYIASHRSNNEMTTGKLEAFCAAEGLALPDLKTSVLACLRDRK